MFKFLALAVLALLAGLGVMIVLQILPDIQRYLRIRSM
jgi:hypothetical protein